MIYMYLLKTWSSKSKWLNRQKSFKEYSENGWSDLGYIVKTKWKMTARKRFKLNGNSIEWDQWSMQSSIEKKIKRQQMFRNISKDFWSRRIMKNSIIIYVSIKIWIILLEWKTKSTQMHRDLSGTIGWKNWLGYARSLQKWSLPKSSRSNKK